MKMAMNVTYDDQMRAEGKIKVIAQKVNPQAKISKTPRGAFQTTIINVLEDGTEQPYRITDTRKRDLLKDLEKLPIENIQGMWVDRVHGSVTKLLSFVGGSCTGL